ncbi:hypothetical protein PHOBOS_184 [Erwinia phage vB_EamM_Phobos]|uniref:hypothetical protein n=1 Tax=Erwinia phage vB_EamM_Phobos TaxID=1883377 RepID=UPI00081CD7ED|nr:hypothetical protein BIZ79_gp184 [Erwinia phage vB_EamM_Phobos]ANZ50374.1 hypothetical protein PHOBOS_184 [Erwinia phage vB_EamM_Phobos]
MSYSFLERYEDELNDSNRSSWDDQYRQFFSAKVVNGNYYFAVMCDLKIKDRMMRALDMWHQRWGHGENPTSRYVATWDEHRMRELYEKALMHNPFDEVLFLDALQHHLNGNLRFSKVALPAWKVSPDGHYWDMPNKLMAIMREIWDGERSRKIDLWHDKLHTSFRFHRCHYFIYQPEPKLWFELIQRAIPSYVKGRLYAYLKHRDMSVLQEPAMRETLNALVSNRKPGKASALKQWKAIQQK